MNQAAKQMYELGVPLVDIWKMASTVPARLIELENQKGAIQPGMDADLIVMNDNFEVNMALIRGEINTWSTS